MALLMALTDSVAKILAQYFGKYINTLSKEAKERPFILRRFTAVSISVRSRAVRVGWQITVA